MEKNTAPNQRQQAESSECELEEGLAPLSPMQLQADDRPETKDLLQRKAAIGDSPQVRQLKALQRVANGAETAAPVQRKAPDNVAGGLPDDLRAGIEQLSGMDMGDVRVHRNSGKAAEAGALAYAQGSDIHLGPGQEQHLPHEAWHVVQQRQGRVQATTQSPNGLAVNDDRSLEGEADAMGAKAAQLKATTSTGGELEKGQADGPIQRVETTKKRTFGNKEEGEEEEGTNKESSKKEGDEKNEKIEIEKNDEEELLVSKYWTRTSVKEKGDKDEQDPKKVMVLSVNLSPERRKTKGDKLQGDHIVAWSAMYRYWQAALMGPLDQSVAKLMQWLQEDQIMDGVKQNSAARFEAYARCKLIASGKMTLEMCIQLFDEAIGYFIQANQASSFATVGKASGGNDEAGGRKILEYYEKTGELPKPSIFSKEDKIEEEPDTKLLDNALKLLDIGKVHDEVQFAYAIRTWVNMLQGLFPKSFSFIHDKILKTKIRNDSVNNWIGKWENWSKSKPELMDDTRLELSQSFLEEGAKSAKTNDRTSSTGVKSNMGPLNVEDGNLLIASEVETTKIEVPKGLRAKTQFGNKQGAHTIAWTLFRQSIESLAQSKTADVLLKKLYGFVQSDLKYVEQLKSWDDIGNKFRLKDLNDFIVQLLNEKKVTEFWRTDINWAITEYIEVNQLLTCSTYSLGGNPTNHGEQQMNRLVEAINGKDEKEEIKWETIVKNAHKFMDLGFGYEPLLIHLDQYATCLDFLGLDKRKKTKEEKTFSTGGMKEEDEKLPELTASKRDRDLKQLDDSEFNSFINLKKVKLDEEDEMLKKQLITCLEQEKLIRTGNTKLEGNEKVRIKNRLEKKIPILRNQLKKSSSEKILQEKEKNAFLARFQNPKAYLEEILTISGPRVKKTFEDYYIHIGNVSPKLQKTLSDPEHGAIVIYNALEAPLCKGDNMIHDPVMNHLKIRYEINPDLLEYLKKHLMPIAKIIAGEVFKS